MLAICDFLKLRRCMQNFDALSRPEKTHLKSEEILQKKVKNNQNIDFFPNYDKIH